MRKYLFSILAGLAFFAPQVAGAVDIKPTVPGMKSFSDVLNGVINISLAVILPIAVITILVAAFFILTAQGDGEKVSKGKRILTFGLAGLGIAILGAGSGALLKNIFRTPEIAFDKSTADLGFQIETCKVGLESKKNELALAQQSGDKKTASSLADLIKQEEGKVADLEQQSYEAGRQTINDTHAYAANLGVDIYDAQAGISMLEAYSTKDGQGFYDMGAGEKFNPDTKEYIDVNGKSHPNSTLLYDGSVLYYK